MRKRAGVVSPASGCSVFCYFVDLLLDLEAEGQRSSDLVLDLKEIGSCTDLVVYDKGERTYPGCRVHGPGCNLTFLISEVCLSLLGAGAGNGDLGTDGAFLG